jgi:GntR family transcriptional regulator
MEDRTMRDRRSLPLQVRDQVLALIKREDLGPGDQLPTEAEIAARFDVARTTAREAFKLLEQDGVVDVRHGLGRYVSQLATLERPITSLESVTEMLGSRGYAVTNRVVSVTVGPANEQEAAALDQPVGTEVIRLERVRLQQGDPLIYSLDVVPHALIEAPLDGEDWSGSLLATLESRGVRVVSAATQIQATRLPAEARRALGTDLADPDGPWILLVQRHVDDVGRPVIYSRDYHRGDRFTFNVVRRRRE